MREDFLPTNETKEILQFAIDNGMLDATSIQAAIEMQKRNDLLKKHPFSIYKGKDGKWYTYLPKANGRIKRCRNTKQDIETVIIEYWKEQMENPTVKKLYEEWIDTKIKREEISKSTKDRYDRQFFQCFQPIQDQKVKTLDSYDIEDFALNVICENKLTRKGFSNFRTLMFGIFKLAKKKKMVSFSITEIMGDLDISKKAFRKKVLTDEEQVFMMDELPIIIKYLTDNLDLLNLGLLLLFKSGLRIGELSALKKCDIEQNVLFIHRTEICYNGAQNERIYEVRDFPKTDAGIRNVVLPTNSIWILQKLKVLNPFGDYVFEKNGERIKTYSFRDRLNLICKKLNIIHKSPHKIRKTYGSILLDAGADESLVIEQMGHVDIQTTKEYYYKNRKSDIQKTNAINNIIGL